MEGLTKTAVVTGATGFVGSHVVAALLEAGYVVRGSVRSLANKAKVAPLLAIAENAPGKLELFEADLLTPGAFGEAADGADVFFHVASPFLMLEQMTDPQADVFEPARLGTQHVIDAINGAESVKRLVLTSTVGAIFGDYVDVDEQMGGTLSERYFNTTSTLENNPYHYAKTVAEQMAWQAQAAQDRWSMVTINPGLILGPTITPGSESGSLFLLDELLSGQFWFGAPNFSFTVVDVRDVAQAHLLAAQNPTAHGRYILARTEMVSFLEMARIVRRKSPGRLGVPIHQVPDFIVRAIGPRFGLTPDYIKKHLGIRFAVDNGRSVNELGLNYRELDETVLAHDESWRAAKSK